jgi:glycerol-3-phosphate acyltransferase PlsY
VIVLKFIGIIVLGYLIGAIPFGVIIGKLARGIDVREYGSGSMGATNVLRVIGVRAGIIGFAADLAKGAAAVALGWLIFASPPAMTAWGQVGGGCAAVIGHCWPVYVKFQGGRGVTTGLGALLTMFWPAGLTCLAIFAIVTGLSRYVSLGSMLAALGAIVVITIFALLGQAPFAYIIYGVVAVAVVFFRHRGNIQRLLSGREPKLGKRAKGRQDEQGEDGSRSPNS